MSDPSKIICAKANKGPSAFERHLSLVLLGALAAIALGILSVQKNFNPAQWRAQPSQEGEKAGPAAPPADDVLPVAGLTPLSAPETYDAVSLSDKIDGKAELYLSAGVKRMDCRRFALTSDPAHWMERFVYDMGEYRNAFAVFSRQRREQVQPLDLTRDAYRSANGIFLVQGPYYLEIVGSDQTDALVEKMIAMARAFIQKHPAGESKLDEPALFPTENLVADSISLTPVHAFGFDRFDRIYTAQYRWKDKTAGAFLSRRASAEEARELAEGYTDFLIAYGGQRVELPAGAPPVMVIEILDTYDIVFNAGDLLAGVHESETLDQGLHLAVELLGRIRGAGHDR